MATLWEGYRKEDVDVVQLEIPVMGECPKGPIEDWRQFQNCYYRLFNDGDTPNFKRMEKLGRIAGIEWDGQYESTLEKIGNVLLSRAVAHITGGCPVSSKEIYTNMLLGSFSLFDKGDWDAFAGVEGVGYTAVINGCTVVADHKDDLVMINVIDETGQIWVGKLGNPMEMI